MAEFESYPKEPFSIEPSRTFSGGGSSTTSIHVITLDGLVNVNSLFTIAVFVGPSLATPGQHSLENPSVCNAGLDVAKKLLVFEVVPFSFFLFSSLVAQGLKLAINLLNSKDVDEIFRAHINLKVLMLSCGSKTAVHTVKDLMKKKEELLVCREHDLIMDQLVKLTSKSYGCLLVLDYYYHLLGTFTDGDLRRALKASGEGIFKLTVGEMCNRNPRTIDPDSMAAEAMQKMESPPLPVQFLPVINDNVLIGIVTLHGLVSADL